MKQFKSLKIIILLFAFIILTLSGCKVSISDKESPIEGNSAPGFLLKDGEGNTNNLKDYLGNVVLLEFWASY